MVSCLIHAEAAAIVAQSKIATQQQQWNCLATRFDAPLYRLKQPADGFCRCTVHKSLVNGIMEHETPCGGGGGFTA